jgi:hypothetical protein
MTTECLKCKSWGAHTAIITKDLSQELVNYDLTMEATWKIVYWKINFHISDIGSTGVV